MSLALNRDNFLQIIVGKAPQTSLRLVKQPVTPSQDALVALLAKRHERYLAEKERSDRKIRTKGSATSSNGYFAADLSQDSLSRFRHFDSHNILSNNGVMSHHHNIIASRKRGHSRRGGGGGSGTADIGTIECTELATRVVSRAKVRLKKRQKRRVNLMHAAYKPASPVPGDFMKNNTLVKAKPFVTKCLVQDERFSIENVRRGVEDLHRRQADHSRTNKMMVVYLSERRSVVPRDTGIPNVPPVSPEISHLQDNIRYVPAMSDLKSQRELKNRLQEMLATRLKGNSDEEKLLKAEEEEENKRKKKESIARLKAKQRAEIYSLNKIMTEFEKERFEAFMSGRV